MRATFQLRNRRGNFFIAQNVGRGITAILAIVAAVFFWRKSSGRIALRFNARERVEKFIKTAMLFAAAVAAWKADDAIDECYLQVCRSLMNALQSDSAAAPTAVPLFFVAKNLERIGDHSTNIAETVFFLARGIPLSE